MSTDGTVVGAMPAPPGLIANFDNPESIAHRVIIISVLGAVIAIPICLVRLYTKRAILRTFGWDDCERRPREMAQDLTTMQTQLCWQRYIVSMYATGRAS
jgi:hypothetical protein